MKALQRLERGGYEFVLQGNKLTFTYLSQDNPPPHWAVPLMNELKERREEVMAIMQARIDWLTLFEEWCGRSTTEVEDGDYVARLVQLANAGQLPCYADGEIDAGRSGWERFAARYSVMLVHTKG